MNDRADAPRHEIEQFDVVIVGAGFAGMYLLHRLRGIGLTARVYEAGSDVGGTWYWNRYPGARCDAESLAYSYSFSPDLEQEWQWTERYATQPEILRYAQHVAERFDLKRDIRFETRVTQAHFDDRDGCWYVETDRGERASAQFCVMATGCLSVPQVPDIEGLRDFAGRLYYTGQWPHEPVDFSGARVGVIGTGSSAIQAIPVIAEQAKQLTVFQRTPNFSVPAVNAPLDPEFVTAFKEHYREHRQNHRLGMGQGFGELETEPHPAAPKFETATGVAEADLQRELESAWQRGGARFIGVIADTVMNESSNRIVADFVRDKISSIVRDPATAAALTPTSHPIGTKRICVDSHYYETYNRPNVSLVNLKADPIVRITRDGVQTRDRFVRQVGGRSARVSGPWRRRIPEPVHDHRSGKSVGALQHDRVDRTARRLHRRLYRAHAREGLHPHRTRSGSGRTVGCARQRSCRCDPVSKSRLLVHGRQHSR